MSSAAAIERARRIQEIESLRRQHQDFKDTPQHNMVLVRELYDAIDHDYEDRIRSLEQELATLQEEEVRDEDRIRALEERLASLRREHVSFRDMPRQERMHQLYNEILLDQEDRIRSLENDLARLLSFGGRRRKAKKLPTFAAFFARYHKRHPNVPAREIFEKYHKAQQLFTT